MHISVASVLLAAGLIYAPRSSSAEPISLEEALRRAESRPTVAIAAADRDAARGNARQAALPLYNPTVDVSAGPRLSSGSLFTGVQLGLSQTIELGGKRSARSDAAEARLRAEDVAVGASARLARIEVWRAYELAMVARMRVEATKEAEATAAEIVSATQQALALGGETQLRINLAAADLGRTRHDLADAENAYATALADLASAMGARSSEHPEPAATAFVFPASLKSEDEASARGLDARPDLAQARAALLAAGADVRAADAAGVPDVTLGITYGYDPDVDVRTHSVLFGASIGLPLRNRNQGARAASRALEHRAQLETDWLVTEVERAARLAYGRYARASAALAAFSKDVSEKLHENLQLATDSFRAGKIDFYAFTLARRELLANRLAYLDALGEAIERWADLARATALEVTP
jgi:cobalt-zinc-cadmium efflux system outer membrane protein